MQKVSPDSTHYFSIPFKRKLCGMLVSATILALAIPSHAQGLPDLGDSSDAVISAQQERTIGKRIMMEIRSDRAFVEDAELSDYISGLGNRMIAASRGSTNDNRRDFEFFLLNDEAINAFALLGGFVAIHSGLFLTTTNESELAGVMGHEIAHILQRHQSRGADEQRKNAPLQLAMLAGAILAARSNSSSSGQATEAIVASSAALSYQNQLNYTRDFEREADRLGLLVMSQAGFDPQGMPGFFERMLRANRHNDGKTPGYLRTHPLTTERIAEMQDRVSSMDFTGKRVVRTSTANFSAEQKGPTLGSNPGSVPDSVEYKLARAKLRAMSMSPFEAVTYFKGEIAASTVMRNRADQYGLTLALMQSRQFAAAEKELATFRTWGGPGNANGHPWIENLAAQIKSGERKFDEALAIYKTAMKNFPGNRALTYGYIQTLYEAGQTDAALLAANEQIKNKVDDPRMYELAAKGFDKKGKRLAEHKAIGEAYYRRGNLMGAIEQFEIAVKAKDGDFYESSGAESRLRELKLEFRNRPLLPGEKRDKELDKELDKEWGKEKSTVAPKSLRPLSAEQSTSSRDVFKR
jgi:beta-barrel assembly-enhancing protease